MQSLIRTFLFSALSLSICACDSSSVANTNPTNSRPNPFYDYDSTASCTSRPNHGGPGYAPYVFLEPQTFAAVGSKSNDVTLDRYHDVQVRTLTLNGNGHYPEDLQVILDGITSVFSSNGGSPLYFVNANQSIHAAYDGAMEFSVGNDQTTYFPKPAVTAKLEKKVFPLESSSLMQVRVSDVQGTPWTANDTYSSLQSVKIRIAVYQDDSSDCGGAGIGGGYYSPELELSCSGFLCQATLAEHFKLCVRDRDAIFQEQEDPVLTEYDGIYLVLTGDNRFVVGARTFGARSNWDGLILDKYSQSDNADGAPTNRATEFCQ